MDYSERVAIITGAANGIGRATSIHLANKGLSLVLIDTDHENLSSVWEEVTNRGAECKLIIGDISDNETPGSAIDAASSLGDIYYLFNNAGIESVSTIEELDYKDFLDTIRVNLGGYFLMTKAVIPHMKRKASGVIVNNSSDAGLRGMRKSIGYGSSKAGVIQFTKSLCLDLAGYNIRVNCICPGVIKTALCDRFNHEIGKRSGISGNEAQAKFIEKYVPLKRYGTTEDVAYLVDFLFSENSSYINGAIIPIDGGLTSGI
ncbi:MAG: SDR family NAD(P)-dependent oxidoreductase [Cyanobacteria bacterium P01_A01_bin.83]